jgi:predicted nuclease of predicted toxin-antitoxin system
MKFLVDECVAWPLVEALRRRFDDVVSVREVSPAAPDADVLEWAVRQSRTLVTEDYDFGELVFYRQLDAEAVVIIAPGVLGVDLLADACHRGASRCCVKFSRRESDDRGEKETSAAAAGQEMN